MTQGYMDPPCMCMKVEMQSIQLVSNKPQVSSMISAENVHHLHNLRFLVNNVSHHVRTTRVGRTTYVNIFALVLLKVYANVVHAYTDFSNKRQVEQKYNRARFHCDL